MATNESRPAITEADVTAFGHKLAAWAEELAPQERAILMATIEQAVRAEGGDVQGYDNFGRPDFGFAVMLRKVVVADAPIPGAPPQPPHPPRPPRA